MNELKINNKTLHYVGPPLISFCKDHIGWSGNSNIFEDHQMAKGKPGIKDLDDAFSQMDDWSKLEGYEYGYVLDYATKTFYYDKDVAKTEMIETRLPIKGEGNYFINFVQKNSWK